MSVSLALVEFIVLSRSNPYLVTPTISWMKLRFGCGFSARVHLILTLLIYINYQVFKYSFLTKKNMKLNTQSVVMQ